MAVPSKRASDTYTPPTKRHHTSKTLSICIPDSILSNAQSFELRTYLVGQIARAAAIYNVEEIVVLKDAKSSREVQRKVDYTGFFIRNLEYVVRGR